MEEVKSLLFTDNMILCMKNLVIPKKVLEIINQFSQVWGYNINTNKLVIFLYTDNE